MITGIGVHDRADWAFTITGIRTLASAGVADLPHAVMGGGSERLAQRRATHPEPEWNSSADGQRQNVVISDSVRVDASFVCAVAANPGMAAERREPGRRIEIELKDGSLVQVDGERQPRLASA
ncbi:MAG: hypothetical protein JO270_16090 [Acidobacteriaceae bacterium]|nr:hypothetical protein [Acidobacteriaceae bacterium]